MALFEELDGLEQRIRSPVIETVPLETVFPEEVEPSVPDVSIPVMEPEPPVVKAHKGFFRRERRVKRSSLFQRQRLFDIETVASNGPVRSTFSLRLDEEGNLGGFDRPRAKPPEIRWFRRKQRAEGGEEPAAGGRFAKLRRVFSRKGKSSEGKTSKLSGIVGKFKGLGRRRGKE